MYFPFLELQKWRKRSAEIRRRNCAVLPKEKSELEGYHESDNHPAAGTGAAQKIQ